MFVLFSCLFILYLTNKIKKDIYYALVMGLFVYFNIILKVFIEAICHVFNVSHVSWWIFSIGFLFYIVIIIRVKFIFLALFFNKFLTNPIPYY